MELLPNVNLPVGNSIRLHQIPLFAVVDLIQQHHTVRVDGIIAWESVLRVVVQHEVSGETVVEKVVKQ